MSTPTEPVQPEDDEAADGAGDAAGSTTDGATAEPSGPDAADADAVAVVERAATDALDAASRRAAAVIAASRDFALGERKHLEHAALIAMAAQDRWQRDAIRFDRILSNARNQFTVTPRLQQILDGTMASTLSSVGEKLTRQMAVFQNFDADALLKRMVSANTPEGFNILGARLDRIITQVTNLLPSPAELMRRGLPENLWSVDVVYDPVAFKLWMDEGVPVAYVLDGSIVNDLAAEASPQARRALLGRRRERIVSDCATLLDGITATEVLPYVETARLAVAGFGAGHHQLAQTWAAANLETLVKQLDERHWGAIRDVAQAPPKLFRWFFFVTQVRTVMKNVGAGPVPTSFNRHASVHFTTTRRHFSKLNAMLAIAHLTSAICNYDAAAKQATAHRT